MTNIRTAHGEQYRKTQVLRTNEVGAIPDKTTVTGTGSETTHLSNSIVFDPDDNEGIYEIPSKPPRLRHAQTVRAIYDNNEADETPDVPSRLGLNSNDNDDGVDVFLSR